MTKSTKCLDRLEIKITPKEWAIKCLGNDDLFDIAIQSLHEQAKERYPQDEDITIREQLKKKLITEFFTLRQIVHFVNIEVASEEYVRGLQAVLKLAMLFTLILRDSFGRTARKATLWIKEYKPVDGDEEEERQIMLNELAAYMNVNCAEKQADSLPLGMNVRLRFPSPIEDFTHEIIGIVTKVFSSKEAIVFIQNKYFDGHNILSDKAASKFGETLKTISGCTDTFNELLKTRAILFKAEWSQEEEEIGVTSAIPGEMEGKLAIDLLAIGRIASSDVKKIANQFVKLAKKQIDDDIQHFSRLKNTYEEKTT